MSGLNIELKTSLIPDADINIEGVLNKRDIKLIRRNEQSIEDLKGDIHMQIYYQQKTKAKDKWLSEQDIDLDSKDIDYLYMALKAYAYLSTTFFVAWIDKNTIISRINKLPEYKRYWSFPNSMRVFWVCPLKNSNKPKDLITYFKKLLFIQESVEQEAQFFSHLPLYSIKAACGYFGDGESVDELGWIKAEGIGHLNSDMFVVQAVGRSMEPRINDGDYCVFQANPAGTRQGKIVLAQHRRYFDEENAGAYSIKKYESKKSYDEFNNWQHEQIQLIPLNSAYEPIIITDEDAEDFRIVAEFIGIIK